MIRQIVNRNLSTEERARRSTLWTITSVGLVTLANGWILANQVAVSAGGVGLCFVAARLLPAQNEPALGGLPARGQRFQMLPAPGRLPSSDPPADSASLVDHMLRQGRYALLLRPEIVPNLSPDELRKARLALEVGMANVPAGDIVVGWAGDRELVGNSSDDAPLEQRPPAVRLERYLLDRYCVSNREYREFVAAGGYEQMSIWEPDIWPGIMDFVDSTNFPGPRFWANGNFLEGEDELPVVGVCWYEASAYARWAGKRLPTDAEWEKAGSWPMHLAASGRPQRRFPWGDALDARCANLWGSSIGGLVAVDAYPEGASIGGIHQLIGNVWEWTSGNFGAWSRPGHDLVLLSLVKSLRGGAFDTYFENQATCQFQSGDDPASRKHNIGFRCALSVCDLVSLVDDATAGDEADSRSTDEPLSEVLI